MLRKGLILLSTFCAAAATPALAADPVLRLTPRACTPPGVSTHLMRPRSSVRIAQTKKTIVRSSHPGGAPGEAGARYDYDAGVTWGLVPGLGQLGSAAFGYRPGDNCWGFRPIFDRYGNYYGQQLLNRCGQTHKSDDLPPT